MHFWYFDFMNDKNEKLPLKIVHDICYANGLNDLSRLVSAQIIGFAWVSFWSNTEQVCAVLNVLVVQILEAMLKDPPVWTFA